MLSAPGIETRLLARCTGACEAQCDHTGPLVLALLLHQHDDSRGNAAEATA